MDSEAKEREAAARAYGETFGVGPMPTGTEGWFTLGYLARARPPQGEAGLREALGRVIDLSQLVDAAVFKTRIIAALDEYDFRRQPQPPPPSPQGRGGITPEIRARMDEDRRRAEASPDGVYDATKRAPEVVRQPVSPEMADRIACAEAAVSRKTGLPPPYWFGEDTQGNPCLFWRNPFSDAPEVLAKFMWPTHPKEWDVDGWWDALCLNIVAAINPRHVEAISPRAPEVARQPVSPEMADRIACAESGGAPSAWAVEKATAINYGGNRGGPTVIAAWALALDAARAALKRDGEG